MEENRTKLTHETYVNDNPPDPKQIRRLAMTALALPKRINRVRRMPTRNACYSVQEVNMLNETTLLSHDGYPSEIRHRMAVRFGSRACESAGTTYSLKFYDTQWYEQQGEWNGVRDLYRFEWDSSGRVNMADKSSLFVPSSRQVDMQDLEGDALQDSFRFEDDAVDMLAVQEQLSQVTADDCEVLIDSVGDFYTNEHAFSK